MKIDSAILALVDTHLATSGQQNAVLRIREEHGSTDSTANDQGLPGIEYLELSQRRSDGRPST